MDRCVGGILPHERFQAWLNLLQSYAVVSAKIESDLDAACGLSPAEHEVLLRLAHAPGEGLRMYDLSDLLLLSKSGITRLVDRLEKRNLVERELSDRDRRVVHARLTADGRAAMDRAKPVLARSVERNFSAHLSDHDIAALRSSLKRVLEGNNSWAEHRCSPAYAEDPATPAT
jgi:DNA-binding MarR family transcriptional regulator